MGIGEFFLVWFAILEFFVSTVATEFIKIPFGKALTDTTDGTITGISTPAEHLDISFGGKSVHLSGIPADGKKWTFKDDVPLGAKTAEIVDSDGNTETITLSPAATFEIPKGWDVDNLHGFPF